MGSGFLFESGKMLAKELILVAKGGECFSLCHDVM